ncbi:hypothetical protein CR513_34512, partial [Mucuna pruriens]
MLFMQGVGPSVVGPSLSRRPGFSVWELTFPLGTRLAQLEGGVVYVSTGPALLTAVKYAMLFLSNVAKSANFPNGFLLGPLGHESSLGLRFPVDYLLGRTNLESYNTVVGDINYDSGMPSLSVSGSSANILYDFDPEIELTLCRLRKVRNTVVSTKSSLNTSFTSKNSVFVTNTIDSSDFSAINSFFSLNNPQQQELMENQD